MITTYSTMDMKAKVYFNPRSLKFLSCCDEVPSLCSISDMVVEDLISTGNSSLLAVEALKEAGANVKGMVAIFTYGFDVSVENFKKANVELYTLSNYDNLLELAVAKNYITEEEQHTLQEWRVSPSTWGVEV